MRPSHALFFPAFLTLAFFAVTPRPALSAEPSEGWTDLLADAGPGLKGWTRLTVKPGGKLQSESVSQWSLDPKSGVLVCEGNGGHEWLRYDREVGDAVFHVEWRFTPVAGKKGYNSGIYARNSADAKVWHQAQTGDASGGFLFGETPTGRVDVLKKFNASDQLKGQRVVKPAGEWNTFEITCKGKQMSLRVNGADAVEFDECGLPKGYLGLEAEGYRIEFKNVKMKELK